jgi:ubiquitin-protein ligase
MHQALNSTLSVQGFMHAPLAVLQYGGVVPVLRSLLHDSVDAMLDDCGRYERVLDIVSCLATDAALAPLLIDTSDHPPWLTPAPTTSATARAVQPQQSIAVIMEGMRGACKIWQNSGAELLDSAADEAHEALEARCLGLVLHVEDVADQVREAATLLLRSSVHSKSANEKREGVGDAAATPSSSDAAAAQQRHETELRKHSVTHAVIADGHSFRGTIKSMSLSSSGSQVRQKCIMRQVSALHTSLPVHWASSIHVAVDAERMDLLRVLILPHRDTPYSNGVFVFDMVLPQDYPQQPPKMQFLTTGSGRVRFNPNLYNCGKVCLSLLGTWGGPSWDPGTSTLLQLLVSLQAMIFCSEPFFNEPGYEAIEGTANGVQQSQKYNERVRSNTVSLAIAAPLKAPGAPPHGVFEPVLRAHWRAKREQILEQLQEWKVSSELQKQVQDVLATI